MFNNFENQTNRLALLKHFDSDTQKAIDDASRQECKVFQGDLDSEVKAHLVSMLDEGTVTKMPKLSSFNIARRIIKQEASIYKEKPVRTYENLNEDQVQKIELINKDMKLDTMLSVSNSYYRLQASNLIFIMPKKGQLRMRILKKHEYRRWLDEDGDTLGYMISNTDLSGGDKTKEIHNVWTEKYNFRMDGEGKLLDAVEGNVDITNPLNKLPFIEVTNSEDLYRGIVKFCIEFNAALSDLYHIMRMQGWSQLIVKGPEELMERMSDLKIGVNSVLFLQTTQKGEDATETKPVDAQYISPSPDLAGSIKVIETLLSAFLTSEGIDPKAVSMSGQASSYSSGWERLLALIEQFVATQEDFDLYKRVEESIFAIQKAYINTYKGASGDTINEKYMPQALNEEASISTTFKKPAMVETEAEKSTRLGNEIALGLRSKVSAIEEKYEVSKEKAQKMLKEIDAEKVVVKPVINEVVNEEK